MWDRRRNESDGRPIFRSSKAGVHTARAEDTPFTANPSSGLDLQAAWLKTEASIDLEI
jgi:hypothetical protein